jgi:hypothetical protein
MTIALRGGNLLALSVSPAVSFAPANLIVRTMIQSDPQNRGMRIAAESNDFYRASEIELDGDKAPRMNSFEFRSLPSGNYQVTAMLLGADGHQRAYERLQVRVLNSDVGY